MLLCPALQGQSSGRVKHHKGRHFHAAVVSKSVAFAKELIAQKSNDTSKSPQDKLAIMFVYSGDIYDEERSKFLKCSLLKLQLNLLPTTPSDIFLWLPENGTTTQTPPAWLSRLTNVHVMGIQREAWYVPALANDSMWVGRDAFELDYYLTGRWRLTFRHATYRRLFYLY